MPIRVVFVFRLLRIMNGPVSDKIGKQIGEGMTCICNQCGRLGQESDKTFTDGHEQIDGKGKYGDTFWKRGMLMNVFHGFRIDP